MRIKKNMKQMGMIIFLTIFFTYTIINIVKSEESITSNEKILIDSLFNEAMTGGKSIKFSHNKLKNQKERQIMLKYIRNEEGDEKPAKYIYMALADVNDDGQREIFAQVFGSSFWCGSHGCTLVILQKQKGKWKSLVNTKDRQEAVMLNTKNYAYHDLAFIDYFNKINKKEIAIWRFDGKYYVPYVFREIEYNKENKLTITATYMIINHNKIMIEKISK